MTFRLTVEYSLMHLHSEFYDRRQKLEMCALNFIVILMYREGFKQPVTES